MPRKLKSETKNSVLELIVGSAMIAPSIALAQAVAPELKNPNNAFVQSATNQTPEYAQKLIYVLDDHLDRIEISGITKPEHPDMTDVEKKAYIEEKFADNKRLVEVLSSAIGTNAELYLFYLAGNHPETRLQSVLLTNIEGTNTKLKDFLKGKLGSRFDQGIVDLTKISLSKNNSTPVSPEHLELIENLFIKSIDHALTAYERFQKPSHAVFAGEFDGYQSNQEAVRKKRNNQFLEEYLRQTFGNYRILDASTVAQITEELNLDRWLNDELNISSLMSPGKRLYFGNDENDLVAYFNVKGELQAIGRYKNFMQKIDEIKTQKNQKKKDRQKALTEDPLLVAHDPAQEVKIVPYVRTSHPIAEVNLYPTSNEVKNSANRLKISAKRLMDSASLSGDAQLLYGVIFNDIEQFVNEITDGKTNLDVISTYQKTIEQYVKDANDITGDEISQVKAILDMYQNNINLANESVNIAIKKESEKPFEDLGDLLEYAETNIPIEEVKKRLPEEIEIYSTFLLKQKYPDQEFYVAKKSDEFTNVEAVILRFFQSSLNQNLINGRKTVTKEYLEEMASWHNNDIIKYGIGRSWSEISNEIGESILLLEDRYKDMDNIRILQDVSRKGKEDEYLVLELRQNGSISSANTIALDELEKKYKTTTERELETLAARVLADSTGPLKAQIETLKTQLEQQKTIYEGMIGQKDGDFNNLKNKLAEYEKKIKDLENQMERETRVAVGPGIIYDSDSREGRLSLGANIMTNKKRKQIYSSFWERVKDLSYGFGIEVTLVNKSRVIDGEPKTLSNGNIREYSERLKDNMQIIATPIFGLPINENIDFWIGPGVGVEIAKDRSGTFRIYDKNGNLIDAQSDNQRGKTRYNPAFNAGLNIDFKNSKLLGLVNGIQPSVGYSKGKLYAGCRLRR